MNRWAIGSSALSLAFTVALAPLVGCGSTTNSAAPDASADSATTDGGKLEAMAAEGSSDAAVDTGPDCGTAPPNGTQIVASTDPLVILALTGDNHAVYEDLMSQDIYGASLSGGTPDLIGKMTSQTNTVWVHDGAVFLYLPAAANPETSIATLSAWSAAGGVHVISTSAVAFDSYAYTYDVAQDGSYVAYYTTENDMVATLMVSTADGKTQTPLATNVDLTSLGTNTPCYPMVQFVGDVLLAQYCASPLPATPVLTIASYAAPTFSPVSIGAMFMPSNGPLAVDPTGKLLLLLGPSGTGLYIYPIAGGASTTVDVNAQSGEFFSNGDVVYTNASTALLRWSATTQMAQTLVPSGLVYPMAISPDQHWMQAAANVNASTGLTDLYLVSTTSPGTAMPLVTTQTAGGFGFSPDSKYSTFGTGFSMDFGTSTFDFEASLTSGGKPTKVFNPDSAPLFTSLSKLIGNTNPTKSTGSADIVSLDLSSTAAPKVLVSQADPGLFLTSKLDLVYSWYCNEDAMAGIWTLPAP
jgi:hypothetical protein